MANFNVFVMWLSLLLCGNTLIYAHSKPSLQLSIQQIQNQGHVQLVTIQLRDASTNRPIVLDDLKTVHTHKIHLLIIDETLNHYSHIHPIKTKTLGQYVFSWQPQNPHSNYRIWADVVPVKTNQQEYLMADLYRTRTTKSPADTVLKQEVVINNLLFTLKFDSPLQQNQTSMGTLTISDIQGNPVRSLEPIMGAFAHLVGFHEDFNSLLHAHPMGQEPTNSKERGGPQLRFHFKPSKSGFTKLFVQVKIKGEEIIIPFGVNILA